jgi:hypothetical protein
VVFSYPDEREPYVLGRLTTSEFVFNSGLLTATMNAWLGGDASVVRPAAAVSAGGLALNVGLLKYLGRIEDSRTIGA